MVDYCRGRAMTFVALALLLTFLISAQQPAGRGKSEGAYKTSNATSEDPDPGLRQTFQDFEVPKEMKVAYRGEWKSSTSGLFDRLKSHSGRDYFECHHGKVQLDCRLFLFDGDWEDDTLYLMSFQNLSYSAEQRTIHLVNSTTLLYSVAERNFANCQVDGNISYSESGTYVLTAALLSEDMAFELDTEMKELTEEERKHPRKAYCLLFTVLSFLLLLAIKNLEKSFEGSPMTAGKIEMGFILMNAIIDAYLCLWHLNLAFQDLLNFDFLLINAFWSFLCFMMLQVRLVPYVWKAQNPEIVAWGSLRTRDAFNAFQSRFLLSVLLTVLVLVLFSQAYEATVPFLHLFFLPQIAANAYYGHKSAVKGEVYLPLGAARLLLVVSSIQLYIFGCPKNFLVWKPNVWICCSVAGVVLVQMALLRVQNSFRGPRFFVPEAYRPITYSYYRSLDEERNIDGSVSCSQAECIICMSLLNVPLAKREEVTNPSKTMHAPCSHCFHEDCLKNWMRIKLECPTCRHALPELEEEQ